MSNTFFRFKQFTVHQHKTAMKVCTDACLFGAWVASEIRYNKPEKILDIGTGTGLLALMVSQVAGSSVDAVEIDKEAFEQASENFQSSPWSRKLNVFHSSIVDFHPPCLYDLIISNPPFYENELKSGDEKRNKALHDAGLTFRELFECAKRLIKKEGRLAILIPFQRPEYFEEIVVDSGFSVLMKMKVRQSPRHGFFRIMYMLQEGLSINRAENEMAIKNVSSGDYTHEFSSLTKDYYL